MSKKKLVIGIVALVLVGGVGYTMTKPKKVVKLKVTGTLYIMPQSFLLNLSEGHYAKLAVGLQLAPDQSDGASASSGSSSGSESAGTLPEEPLVREIVTNSVTGQSGSTLISDSGRDAIKQQILTNIRSQTDLKVTAVLFPEITVQ
jgi:flagellar basal body-associated protein FliL